MYARGVLRLTLFALGVVALAPFVSHAQVLINEAMYDPPGSDSGQEWIELYNAGAAEIDLTKWKLVDGSSATKHSFNVPPKNGGVGSIVIPAGGYVIVADDAATFEAAYPSVQNVIDSTMSMPDPNSGVKVSVTLIDDTGASEDTFTYTGGTNADNKGDSAQRAGTSIIPASPTPAAVNATVADKSTPDTSNGTGSSQASSTATTATVATSVSSYVAPPVPDLYADAGGDRTVIVGADTEFDAIAYDKNQNVLTTSVRYIWNFGDGQTAEGESVLHHYSYPGKYAVVLTLAEDKSAAIDEITVAAEPAKISFSVLPDGGVEIDNLAGRDLDLSDWIVRAAPGLLPASFMLPPYTIILTGSSMQIARSTLNFTASQSAVLEYPNGAPALTAGQSTTAPAPTPTIATAAPIQVAHVSQPTVHIAAAPAIVPVPDAASTELTATDTVVSQTAAVAGETSSSLLWWFAAAALAAAAAGAVVFAKRAAIKEWDIIEEK